MPNPECACHSLPCSLWPEKSKTWKYFKKDKMGRCPVRRVDTSVPQPNGTRTANSRRCTCIEIGDLTLPSEFNSHEGSAHALTNRCLWQGGSLAAGFHCCFVLPSWKLKPWPGGSQTVIETTLEHDTQYDSLKRYPYTEYRTLNLYVCTSFYWVLNLRLCMKILQ